MEYSGNYPTCDEKVKGVELKQLKRQLPTNSKTARLQNSNNNPRYNHSKTAEIKEDISNAVRKNRHYLQRSKNKFNSWLLNKGDECQRKRIKIWKDGKIVAVKEIFCIKKNYPSQNTGWKKVIFKVKKKIREGFF